ncbi:MAG: MBL fold metallo-hydrolase [bacterium]|nr:MBL fold metallo-hydrolase [bacterium]
MRARITRPAAVAAAVLIASAVAGAQDWDAVEIEATHVAGNVHMLAGAGGNLGVVVGEYGVFLVDDQYAPLTDKIRDAVTKISDQPIRFVVNTHWHGDHTGGNENLGQTGTVVVAHENVRARMSVEQVMEALDRTVPASSEAALPVITFPGELTFHLGGEEARVFHVERAHTDGDSMIWFPQANVLHMGDVLFHGVYPFLDVGSGGSIDGLIAAVGRALAMIDDETKVIPGHGELTDRAGLEAYRAMLESSRAAIAPLVRAGKSREEIIAAKPTAATDETLGGGWIKPDQWVGFVYDSLTEP